MKAPNRKSVSLERAVDRIEHSLDPLFAAGRYRDFFTRAQATREAIKPSGLSPDARRLLWERLNRCTDAAKARQEREFAERHAANLARWRERLAAAQRYATVLPDEIAELKARSGPRAEQALWQRRAAEKEARLADVRAGIVVTEQKIAGVARRARR